MLMVLVVKEVDKAYDNLGIEIVPAIEKLSLYMLEACQTQQPLCHFALWGETPLPSAAYALHHCWYGRVPSSQKTGMPLRLVAQVLKVASLTYSLLSWQVP